MYVRVYSFGELAESCLPAGRGRKTKQNAMCWVYILKSQKDKGFYIGKTNNIDRRLREHNSGQVKSTKARRPLIILEKVSCDTDKEALRLEKKFKKGYKREQLYRKYK